MADLSKMAQQVEERARELLPDEEWPEMDGPFIKQCLDANERGDGVLFALLFMGKYIQNVTPRDDEWYSWQGNVWAPDDFKSAVNVVERCTLEYQRLADELQVEIERDNIDKKHPDAWKLFLHNKYKKRVDRLRSKAGANSALYWAPIIQRSMACKEENFNQHPWLLPVANGVIDLKTGALNQGQPADLMTKALEVDYDPHADYSLWHKTVVEICGSEEMAGFLKRSFGYAITGKTIEQYFWVFIGPGRNGKGVIFSLIGKVLGPFYHEINKAMILQQRNQPSPNAATEHLYSLLGKRLIVGAETNKGEKIDGEALKRLTGEDKITCRPNFKSEISFYPNHSIFLHTNHVPYGLTADFAMTERMLLVEFPNMYVDDVEESKKKYPAWAARFRGKNKELKEELTSAGLSGILRWLVEGCLEWQQTGLSPPDAIIKAVDKLSAEEDYVGQFVGDCLNIVPDQPDARLPCKSMYAAFEWWWSENMDSRQKRMPAMKTVNKQLRDRGFIIDKRGGRTHVFGMILKTEIMSDIAEYNEK